MTEKTILREERGTIKDIYDYITIKLNEKKEFKETCIDIELDNKGEVVIAPINNQDFYVGQRVVHVTYTWKREVSEDDEIDYSMHGYECPNEIDEFEYAIYDELSYDKKQLKRTRSKRKTRTI